MQTLALLRNGELKGATTLKLSEGLTHFPQEIFDLADTLEVLDLSRNKISDLPADLRRLHKLRVLFCSENLFTTLPRVLADCPLLDIVGFKANQIAVVPPRSLNPNIRWLILTDNQIAELPATIGACARMRKLMLAGNRLNALPEELKNCLNLSLLRVSANQLERLPSWLLSMPRLSWLAFSGNRFSLSHGDDSLPFINWGDLHVHHMLGEGASGTIFKGELRNGTTCHDVAVKIFKGAVTSDGLPEDEMNTFMAAGSHPGLVRVLGRVAEHPENKKGLVMELIPDLYFNLGQPPTFDTCTRDVFTKGQAITVGHAIKIAATIASVAALLHERGIMHGDLYAHNTLIDGDANTLLSDFGAASFYDPADTASAPLLERIEVSAFGHMLDDLLSICVDAGGHPATPKLETIRDLCTTRNLLSRPYFQYLFEQLKQIGTL